MIDCCLAAVLEGETSHLFVQLLKGHNFNMFMILRCVDVLSVFYLMQSVCLFNSYWMANIDT